MDPTQFVAQLAELRTQDQQLHQALQQVQQQQSQQQEKQSQSATKSHPSFVRFASLLRRQWDRQCWPQQIQHEPIRPWWIRKVWESLHR